MLNLLLFAIYTFVPSAFSAEENVGSSSVGTVGITLVIPPKPIASEMTETDPTPWNETCNQNNIDCTITENNNGDIHIVVIPQ